MTMNRFAQHVFAVSGRENLRINNLQLSKVIYFALGDYIANNGVDKLGRSIYTEPFVCWTYGPAIESVYIRYKRFGRFPIQDSGKYVEEYASLDDYIRKYIRVDGLTLARLSQTKEMWKSSRQRILLSDYPTYTLRDLERDFTD